MIATIAVLVLAVLIVGWYITAYNGLVSGRNAAEMGWADVEVELKRRLDLIDNLVETVKGYSVHEQETLERVIAARNRAQRASSPEEAGQTEGALLQSVRGLLALAEAYPDLKADGRFGDLQAAITETENRIAGRRSDYNQTAKVYRDLCQSFPSVIVAGVHGFQPKPFFDVPDEWVAAAPRIKFT